MPVLLVGKVCLPLGVCQTRQGNLRQRAGKGRCLLAARGNTVADFLHEVLVDIAVLGAQLTVQDSGGGRHAQVGASHALLRRAVMVPAVVHIVAGIKSRLKIRLHLRPVRSLGQGHVQAAESIRFELDLEFTGIIVEPFALLEMLELHPVPILVRHDTGYGEFVVLPDVFLKEMIADQQFALGICITIGELGRRLKKNQQLGRHLLEKRPLVPDFFL